MNYAVEIGSGATIHTKFHKDSFRHSKLIAGFRDTQAHREQSRLKRDKSYFS
jgi:hypothetical protein